MPNNHQTKPERFAPGYLTFLLVTAIVAICTPMVMGFFVNNWIAQCEKAVLPESGFVDRDGNFAFHKINTVYWNSNFHEGRCVGPDSVCDKRGKLITQTQFFGGEDFSEGLAAVRFENDRWGFIDLTGRPVTSGQFDKVQSFSDGFAPAKQNGLWGFIDCTGKWLVTPTFENARPFSEGLAAVCQNNKIGYIDETGTMVISAQYDVGAAFSEGIAQVGMFGTVEEPGPIQYIDKTGKIVFELGREYSTTDQGVYAAHNDHYDLAHLHAGPDTNEFRTTGSFPHPNQSSQIFKNGRQQFCKDGRFGYLNKKGDVAIPFKFTSAAPFSEGLACVSVGEGEDEQTRTLRKKKFGFIDANGKFVIEPTYLEARNFHDGRAFVKDKDGTSGFIDKKGRMVISVKSGNASDFYDGLAAVGPHMVYP